MPKVSEVDALKAVDEVLSGLEDGPARDRVVRWALAKYGAKPSPESVENPGTRPPAPNRVPPRKKVGPKSGKSKVTLSLVKDLDLKPPGKRSFDKFASEKQPKSNEQKCTISVYYLRQELGLSAVSAGHVLTCFKSIGWRIPANLPNALQYTASVKGWLDTSNSEDLKVTAIGENLVEHDLPAKTKVTKKP